MDDYMLESANAASDYLDTLIRIADKYKLNRKEHVLEQLPIMVCASAAIDYDEYIVKGE